MRLSGAVLGSGLRSHRQVLGTFTEVWQALSLSETAANLAVLDGAYAFAAQSAPSYDQPIEWFTLDFGHTIFVQSVALQNAGLRDTEGDDGRACQMQVRGSQDGATWTLLFTVASNSPDANLSSAPQPVDGAWRYLRVDAQSITDTDNGLFDGFFYMDCFEVVGSL